MKKKGLVLVVVLLLAIIAVLIILLITENKTHKQQPQSAGVVMQSHSENERSMVGTNEPSVCVPGWTAIKLPANTKEAELSLHNPKENKGNYDLEFSLRLKDTGDIVFCTGKVEAGMACTSIVLNRELEIGEYAAVMIVQPYSSKSGLPVNNAELELLLIVE